MSHDSEYGAMMYAPPPLPEHQRTLPQMLDDHGELANLPHIQTTLVPPALLATLTAEAQPPAPVDIVKDNLPKLTPAQRKVIRQLLDAYDSLDQVR